MTDIKSALNKAVSGNKPKNSDITCHYLYELRNHLLGWYTKGDHGDSYFKKLSEIFNNAYSDAGKYKLFRPLLGYDRLNKALLECSKVCANIKKYFKDSNNQRIANKAAIQAAQAVISNLQPSIQNLLTWLQNINQNICNAYNINMNEINKLKNTLSSLEQKIQRPILNITPTPINIVPKK